MQILDENGNIVNTYSYDEWGNILTKQETIANPIRYAGEYYDEESGLYYLRARYYDPVLCRFITKDSYEGDITNPLSLNQYAYCQNNPIIYVDPSGHWVETALDIASIGMSANDLYNDPSLLNAGLLLWDVGAALLPVIPASHTIIAAKSGFEFVKVGKGYVKRKIGKLGSKLDDLYKGTSKTVDEMLEAVSHSNQHSKGARWIPENLKEKLALEEVLSNPSAGEIMDLKKGMTDPRWDQNDGWVKMYKNVNGVEIHYVWNEILNVFDDFKIK